MLLRRAIRRREYSTCSWKNSRLVQRQELKDNIDQNDLLVEEEVISAEEEQILVDECTVRLKRRRYERNHWDNVIVGFKEFEASNWSDASLEILDKVRHSRVLLGGEAHQHQILLPSVHVIDLAPDGFIRPHIDSIKFCGSIVAGLSLLSDRTMRFQHQDSSLDVSLPARSFYLMTGALRYTYTHEILPRPDTPLRRISIIFRNQLEARR